MADEPQQQQQQLQIELPEEVADGEYANLVMIAHSPEEFILDFIRLVPGRPKARVKSRVIVSPAHAKRFLRALEENIGRYERSHGEIAEGGGHGPEQPLPFGPGGVA